MNKNNLKKLLEALKNADPPLSTRDFNLLIPEMNERTLRRGLVLAQEKECIVQVKGGRGYGKGVSYTILSVNKENVAKLQRERGLDSD